MKNDITSSRDSTSKNLSRILLLLLSLILISGTVLAMLVINKNKDESRLSPPPIILDGNRTITGYDQVFKPVKTGETFIIKLPASYNGELQFRWYQAQGENIGRWSNLDPDNWSASNLGRWDESKSDWDKDSTPWEISYKLDDTSDYGVGKGSHEDRAVLDHNATDGHMWDTSNDDWSLKDVSFYDGLDDNTMHQYGYFLDADKKTTFLPVKIFEDGFNQMDKPTWVKDENVGYEVNKVEIFRVLVRGRTVGFDWSKPTVVDIVLAIDVPDPGTDGKGPEIGDVEIIRPSTNK